MLLAIIVGYAVFSEVPTQTMLTGAGMIVTAGVLIIWRERQLGLERARQRKAGNQRRTDAQVPARARQSASTACPCRTTAPSSR
jgi:hypothetical protein